MAVFVKISDVIKMMKELRNEGYKEISFTIDEEGDPEVGMPPSVMVDALDPEGIFDAVSCDNIEGRNVDIL